MTRKPICSDKAPKAIGPYSQGIRAGQLLFLSGQIPIDPRTGEIEPNDIKAQTRQVLANIQGLLSDQNLWPEDVVKVTIFLKDMNDFAVVNQIYGDVFRMDPPARECVEVARLPRDVLIEISCIAMYRTSEGA